MFKMRCDIKTYFMGYDLSRVFKSITKYEINSLESVVFFV